MHVTIKKSYWNFIIIVSSVIIPLTAKHIRAMTQHLWLSVTSYHIRYYEPRLLESGDEDEDASQSATSCFKLQLRLKYRD